MTSCEFHEDRRNGGGIFVSGRSVAILLTQVFLIVFSHGDE